jgi:hypothetical protein
VASIERTAYPRFKRAVPVRELHEAFAPAAGEIAWAREQTRTPEHPLALVVLLKACHPLGYFPVLAQVPPPVIEHIRGVLELKPDVRARHDSDRTLWQHKSLVRARLGITADPGRAREVAGQAIRVAAQAKDNPADLINVALEELVWAGPRPPAATPCPPPTTPRPPSTASPQTADQRFSLLSRGFRRTPAGPGAVAP